MPSRFSLWAQVLLVAVLLLPTAKPEGDTGVNATSNTTQLPVAGASGLVPAAGSSSSEEAAPAEGTVPSLSKARQPIKGDCPTTGGFALSLSF